MMLRLKIIVLWAIMLALSGCLEGGNDFQSLDSSSGNTNAEGVGRCSIVDVSPANTGLVKVSGSSVGLSSFSITPQGTNCTAKYFLNGSTTALSEGALLSLASSLLNPGENRLRVELTGPIGSDFKEWTLVKNVIPSCSMVAPSLPNINATEGSTPTLTVTSTVEAGETASFQWLLNGDTSNRLTRVIEGGGSSQYQLSTSGLTGVQAVRAIVSDGLDTATCDYQVNIGPDCSLTGKDPSVASLKVANTGASQAFSVTSPTSSCLVSWTINSIPVTGSGLSRNVASSELSVGANIVKATVISSSGTSEQNWVVTRNTIPTCSQSPIGTVQVSSGATSLLQSLFSDTDNDPLTWSWRINGAIASTPLVTVVDGANQSSGTFAPTDANIGFNTLTIQLSDGYDSVNCNWTVQVNPACGISSKSPDTSALTIANLATTNNIFAVTPTAGSCNVAWELNGVNLGSAASLQTLMSNTFLGTPNTLRVTVSNASSTQSHTWTVNKNKLPVCQTQTPNTSGHIFGVGASQDFYLAITDADGGQSHSFTWKLNGATPHASFFSSVENAANTTGTWVPLTAQAGSHNLAVDVFDGYDTRTCSWSTTVLPNCAVTSSSPSGATLKVPFLSSHSSSFAAVANSSSCNIEWSLNGTPISSGSFLDITSASLTTSNTLTATLSNAVSSTTRSWTVTKNTVSTCSSQTPSASGNQVDLGDFVNFIGTAGNPDGDTLSFNWLFAGNSSASFSSINHTASQSSAQFTPNGSQIGLAQLIRLQINDGYDSSQCDWTLDIRDPNQAQILSWSPATDPVVITSSGSVDLSVVAVGTGITFSWYVNGNLQGSRTGSTETFTHSQLAVGNHAVRVVVTDTYNNTAEKIFNVKRNARPVLGSFAPNESGVNTYRVGVNGHLGFSASATDANGDTLVYDWTLNNMSSAKLVAGGGGTNADLGPDGDTLLVGAHTVRVTVSDGHESISQSWSVAINYFSDECNLLYNSASTGANGGKVCTLVGNPSIGDNEEVLYDPTLFKGSPNQFIELENNVYAFTDNTNHIVAIVNNSGTTKTYFGRSIQDKKMRVILGMGQRGITSQLTAYVDNFNSSTGQPNIKLWQPVDLAYDSSTQVLYVSEYQNHRVIAINNDGRAIRVLGLTNRSTATTTAAATGDGQAVSCANPYGITLNQEGVNKFLYVACWGHHVIKKVDITNFTGSNSVTFSTTIAVGRLTSNSTAVYASGSESGLAGSANNPSSGSVARLTNPTSLFSKGGLIYFADSFRLQVYNPSNNQRELYPDYLSYPDRFTSITTTDNFYFRTVALENTWTTHGVQKSRINQYSTNNPASYTVVVASTGRTVGGCHLGIIEARNGSRIKVNSSTNVTTTTDAPILHLTPDCSDSASSSISVPIAAGRSQGYFWYKPNNTTARTLSAPVAATLTGSAVTAGTLAHASTMTSTGFDVNDCNAVEVRLSASNANSSSQSLASSLNMTPMTNNFGTFYSDINCSTPLPNNRLIFNAGEIGVKTVFYNRRTLIEPNHVAPIFGNISIAPFATGGLNTYSIYTTSRDGSAITSLGAGQYSNSGSRFITPIGTINYGGFDYPQTIAFGAVTAAVPSGTGNNGVMALNLSSDDINIGKDLARYSVRAIGGQNADNFTAGYAADDMNAIGALFNDVMGVIPVANETKLLIADRGNNRGRFIELSGSGFARGFLGVGRLRERTNALQIQANQSALARPFKLEFFNNHIYFSELNNHRIRRVSLTTGITEVVAGAGYGTSFNEGNDTTAEFMRSPKGFKVIAWPNSLSPTNYILVYAESCQIRAVNFSGPTISSFMGVSNILPGKVKTIVGDTSVACQATTQWTGYNSNGMSAIAARFRDIYDVAFIKNEIYFMDHTESCLLRVNSSGQLYEVGTGTCNTGASNEGEFNSGFSVNRPIAFAPDMGFPMNYFVLDNYYNNSANLSYINTTATNQNFVQGTKIGYGTSNVARSSVIYNPTGPSGLQARPGGVASWSQTPGTVTANDRICWSSGDVDTNVANAVHGNHAITCALRSAAETGSIAVGPLSGDGAGGPLGFEQESTSRFNVTFWGPTGIAFDEEGNLYIADSGNHIIRMVRRWW